MYSPPLSPQPLRLMHFFTHWLIGLFAAVLLAFAGISAHAAAPAANASISNQASASYADGSGVTRTVTSNVVTTTVSQVRSMTLVADNAQTATPGSVVYYPHTLTNTGNGSDTFALAANVGTGTFTMTSVQIFADNGSGQPTGSPISSTGLIAAGATFKFIVVGTLPATAAAGNTNAITVTGSAPASGGLAAVSDTKTDTTTVTTNAVVTLTKAISASSGAPGSGPYTYTLTYTNTGNSTATAVAISDAIPAGMTYVPGSARWSVTGATALSDTVAPGLGVAPNTVVSSYTAATRTFLATLAQVTAGQSGTLSFQVNVNSGVAPGVLLNTATTSYNNGSGGAAVTGISNTVPFTVTQTAGVTFTGPATVATANTGDTVSFTNVLANTGTGTDTFNITLKPPVTGGFPTGTTFQLYKPDGVTPLVDTNGDGVIDTGPLPAYDALNPSANKYNVILKATLPPNASGAPAGGYTMEKTATSVFDPSKTATATDKLTAIMGASVDLSNAAVAPNPASGVGPGLEATAQQTNSLNPGDTTVFTLATKNTGPSPDTYNFSVAGVPSGWTVTFKESVNNACSSTGATIINSGNVSAGGTVTVCAVVTVPAGYPAGTTNLNFKATSPTSAVSDTLHDAVKVNAVRSITLTPNGAGQTYPGGSYVYSHTLTNTGNVVEGGTGGAISSISLAGVNNQAANGWTSTLYYDNGSTANGLDSTDTLITGNLDSLLGAGLAPGASITIFNKVIAPSGAVPGAVNATNITVTTSNGTTYSTLAVAPAVATDSTTVIAGNLTLAKVQALDATCDGIADGAYASTSLSAKPGECVLYQITVTNVGSADATAVVVSDATPTYTKMKGTAAAAAIGYTPATAIAAPTAPGDGLAGAVTATIGTLPPSKSATLTFGVKIDN